MQIKAFATKFRDRVLDVAEIRAQHAICIPGSGVQGDELRVDSLLLAGGKAERHVLGQTLLPRPINCVCVEPTAAENVRESLWQRVLGWHVGGGRWTNVLSGQEGWCEEQSDSPHLERKILRTPA